MNDFDKFQRALRGEKVAGIETISLVPIELSAPIIPYVKPKDKRGGNREGAGRPTLSPNCATVHIDICLPANLQNKARFIGNGNVSEGIRLALDLFPE